MPSFAGGGAERVAINLIAHLGRPNVSLDLCVLDATGPLAQIVPDHVSVTNLARPRLRNAFWPVVRWLRRSRPQIVLSTFGYVNLALLAIRPLLAPDTRLVIREANTPSQSLAQGRAPAVTALAYRLFYPTADMVLCQHRKMAAEMVSRFGVDADRTTVLPNPVDADRVRPRDVRREPGPGRRFVAAGRLTRQKGFDRLIDLFGKSHPQDHLTLFGDGPDRAALEARIFDRGLQGRVRLAGFEANPWPWYAGADAVLLSSRWEGMPNVALESLACGTPVIATPESGGIAEVAADAPKAAVSVAQWGKEFAAALSNVAVREDAQVRSSLLPVRYQLKSVADQFEALLESL